MAHVPEHYICRKSARCLRRAVDHHIGDAAIGVGNAGNVDFLAASRYLPAVTSPAAGWLRRDGIVNLAAMWRPSISAVPPGSADGTQGNGIPQPCRN